MSALQSDGLSKERTHKKYSNEVTEGGILQYNAQRNSLSHADKQSTTTRVPVGRSSTEFQVKSRKLKRQEELNPSLNNLC
jgi:hypothetical protein